MYAAAEKNSLLFRDGKIVQWVIFLPYVIKGELKASTMKSIEYMTFSC
jgi:hypothetical protein